MSVFFFAWLFLGRLVAGKDSIHPVVDVFITNALYIKFNETGQKINSVPLVIQAPDLSVIQHPLWKAPNLVYLWVIIWYVK